MLTNLNIHGYHIAPQIFTNTELTKLRQLISTAGSKTTFASRYLLENKPELLNALRSCSAFTDLLTETFSEPVIIRSVYFDKPPRANWTVAWHQDITVNFTEPIDRPGYQNWRELPDRVAVQAPVSLLKQITTYRIHLDDTDESNGALRVIKGSHDSGIERVDENYGSPSEGVLTLYVPAGGVQLMKPLLFHSSRRTRSDGGTVRSRRVIHLELIERSAAESLPWREYFAIE